MKRIIKVRNSMTTLYIIGNGFDSAHGLETRYWKLREHIEAVDYEFLREFEAMYNIMPLDSTEPWYEDNMQKKWNVTVDHILWSEFEKFMGFPNTTSMLEMSLSVTDGMPKEGIKDTLSQYWKDVYGFIKRLKYHVRDWVESIDTNCVVSKKEALKNSNDLFFTFNYTDVLEKVYNAKNILHIHGGDTSISEKEPIMGHCNKNDIIKHRELAEKAAEEFNEVETSIQAAVANFLEEIYKNTANYIEQHQPFFKSLNNITKVVVFGWSAGEVDRPYLREIISNIDKNAHWSVYWYDEKAYDSLKSAFESEGIVGRDMIEYIEANKFWD